MQGLINKYDCPPGYMYCNCGNRMELFHRTSSQAIFRCKECLLMANYKRDPCYHKWELTGTTVPEIKQKIDESVLAALVMKVDAISSHLGVEIVNVPEHYKCEDI